MKFFIVFAALFAIALAAPANPDADAQVIRSDSEVGPESHNYAYETSNGIKGEESGVLNNVGSDHESLAVKGSFSFVGDDGKTYLVNYIADENGFQPQGEHIPQP